MYRLVDVVPLPGNILPQADFFLRQVWVGSLFQETQPHPMLATKHLLNLEDEVDRILILSSTCQYHGIQIVRVKHGVGVLRHLLLPGSLKVLSILLFNLSEPERKTWRNSDKR